MGALSIRSCVALAGASKFVHLCLLRALGVKVCDGHSVMSDVLTQVMAKARGLWHAGKYQKSVEVMQLLGNSDLPSQVTSYSDRLKLSGALHPAAGG